MAAPLLARGAPFLLRLQHRQLAAALTRQPSSMAVVRTPPEKMCLAVQAGSKLRTPERSSTDKWAEDPDYRKWKDKEEEILKDIRPITLLVKEIIHSSRYMDGERLTLKDEKIVIERLLAYHPHCDDKIGCGLDSILVDQHPQFRQSRCLFVLRIDGGWIDFSYQKCIRAYIRHKYPSYAERFIKEHYKRGSG